MKMHVRIILIVFLFLSGIFSFINYHLYSNIKDLIVAELGRNATNVAITTAKFIEQDIESYAALSGLNDYEQGHYDENYYKKMQYIFQKIKKETGVTFIFTQKMVSNQEVAYILDGEDPQSQWFSPLGSMDDMGELELSVFNEGVTGATTILEWQHWGEFLTGYSPITDPRNGEIIGLVGADFSLKYVHRLLLSIKNFILGTAILVVFLGTFLSYKLIKDKFIALNRDYLTDLYSKRYHDAKLKDFIKKAQETKLPLSLMMIDIDYFKSINDQYGHETGDKIIKFVAQIIKLFTRNNDVCSRFGGDEFTVILPNTDLNQGKFIANRIVERLNDNDLDQIKKEIGSFDLSLSIGIAEWQAEMSSEQLSNHADTAMYRAKKEGKNRVKAYEDLLT